MKTRASFVSNSSSSSFIASVKLDKNGKAMITIDLSKLGDVAINEEQLKDLFMNKYDFSPDNVMTRDTAQYNKLYNYCLEKIEDGQVIIGGQIDNMMVGVLDYIKDGQPLERDGYIEI